MASDGERGMPTPEEAADSVRRLMEHFGRLTSVMEMGGFVLPDSTYEMLGVPRPRLHQTYTAEEGVAAFGEAPAEWLCDGQFAVLPGLVLCFFTFADAEAGPFVESPTRVVWRPGRSDYAPDDDEQSWLPRAVREPRRPDGERHWDYHLFLRRTGEERYLYAGRGGLGGWTNPVAPRAEFDLMIKLPRDAWERFGGYRGWLVSVDRVTERLALEDSAGFERLLTQLPPDEGSIHVTRYEGDNVNVSLNAERGVVYYTAPEGHTGATSRDPGVPAESEAVVVFPDQQGGWDVPRRETVPRPLAIAAALEFFRTGQRPECIAWSDPPAPPAPAPPPATSEPRIGYVTEAEWLTGTNPEWLLRSLQRAPAMDWLAGVDLRRPAQPIRELLDDRKLRLLAAACCRRVWHLMTDARSRRVVEVIERHTDGRATDEEWAEAGAAAQAAWNDTSRGAWPEEESARGAHAALHATTTAAAQLGPGVLQAQPGMWAYVVACEVVRETARAVNPDYSASSERRPQCDLIRDIFGNPFRQVTLQPEWRTPTVLAIAQAIAEERAFDRLPILADALEETGCTSRDVLDHCRSAGPHVPGCWVVDLILGRGEEKAGG